MSSSEGEGAGGGKILQRHRQEIKALKKKFKNEIQRAKQRQRKRELEAEEKVAETELIAKHRQELKDSNIIANKSEEEEQELADEVSAAKKVDAPLPAESSAEVPLKEVKLSKGQRRVERRRRQQEEEADRARIEAGDMPKLREAENANIEEMLRERGYEVHPVAADGNCLFRAVDHQIQMSDRGTIFGHRKLRRMAADEVAARPSAYLPYLVGEIEDGEDLSDEKLVEKYVLKMRDSDEYGGDVELKALSEVLQRRVEVFSAGSAEPIAFVSEQASTRPRQAGMCRDLKSRKGVR